MTKVIVYAADGTWNGAGHQSALETDKPELSNVYRLFCELKGEPIDQVDGGIGLWAEEKVYRPANGAVAQVAMYGHGVGENVHNPEEHLIGGAFGGGLTTRIRLGYAFISRHYLAGDQIVITGFSRGAYAARALADMIAEQGLLKPDLAIQHHPLSWSAGAWLKYREGMKRVEHDVASEVERTSEKLHCEALKAIGRYPGPDQLTPATVSAIGVFDTVGSLGLPTRKGGVRHDDYGFVTNELHPKIKQAFHAVSIDEERADFIPTFWDPKDGALQQVLFPGAHSDVGGGYIDHALADVAMEWMFHRLAPIVLFKDDGLTSTDFLPNSLGTAHRPWTHGLSGLQKHLRSFPNGVFGLSDSAEKRMHAGKVPLEGSDPCAYRPTNLPVFRPPASTQ